MSLAVAVLAVGGLVGACSTPASVTSTHADRPESTSSVPRPGTSVPGTSVPGTSVPDDGSTPSSSDPNGIGDPLFPPLGNPGVDVTSYDVHLDVSKGGAQVAGNVDMEIRFTEPRSEFTLDLDGPEVTAVTVDGETARFTVEPQELRITLPTAVSTGDDRLVSVTYTAAPTVSMDFLGVPVGWNPVDGGSWTQNEPDGARTWMPCDDHPSDKANYTFTITVPKGLTAVANGELVEHRTVGDREVWSWNEPHPMATYLVQVLTGDYELVEGAGPHGLPLLSAILRGDRGRMKPYLDVTPSQIEFFEQWFGPYPFSRYGIAVAPSLNGVAIETQERSLFGADAFSGTLGDREQSVLSHELAHQWFGDAVTPARWDDVWLNESFATYGEWMWLDHVGSRSVDDAAGQALAVRQPGITGRPPLDEMFGALVYDGGAVVLHALRRTVGDEHFFAILRRWVADNNGESRRTSDFISLAEQVSGSDLTAFFHAWLYSPVVPSEYPKSGASV
jgi:aminopeptidase N